jgi:hypothetical protein
MAIDQISGDFTDVTASASNGGACTPSATSGTQTSITCMLGMMTSGEEVTLTITVTAGGTATVQSNTATVSSDTDDPKLANNVTTADTITVVGGGDGGCTVDCLEGSGLIGSAGGCALDAEAAAVDSRALLGFITLLFVSLFALRGRRAMHRR